MRASAEGPMKYCTCSLFLQSPLGSFANKSRRTVPCFAVGEEEVQDLLLVVDSINGWCPSFDDQPKALADLLFEAGAESL